MTNPHIAFGSGIHNCMGAAHARLLVRSLLKKLTENVASIEILDAERKIEREKDYERKNAYDSLTVRIHSKTGYRSGAP